MADHDVHNRKIGAGGAVDFKRARFVDEMMKLDGQKPAEASILAAYQRAGFRGKDATGAYAMLREPDVAQALADRRAAIGRRLEITGEKLLRDLEVLKFKAAAAGQFSAAIRAVELQARYINAFPNQDPLDRLGAQPASDDDEPRFPLRQTARLILFELQVAMRAVVSEVPAEAPTLIQ